MLENSLMPPVLAVPLTLRAELSIRPENPMSSKRDQEGSGFEASAAAADWLAEEMLSRTLRHSSVSAFTVSSYAENCCNAASSSRYSKFLARRKRANGVGDTESTIITTFVVRVCISVGVCGGYSVWDSSDCRERGRLEMPPTVLGSGASERRYAKKRWLAASAALGDSQYALKVMTRTQLAFPMCGTRLQNLCRLRRTEKPTILPCATAFGLPYHWTCLLPQRQRGGRRSQR